MNAAIPTLGSVLFGALAASLVSAAGAQDIFKCVSNEGTVYQSTPCAPGAEATRITTGVAVSAGTEAQAHAARAPRQPLRNAGPWKRTTLALGMSDDEVLNLPGWGRPTRIVRTKMPREWREEWVYDQATDGEQYLYFANARLVSVTARPWVDQFARLAAQ